MSGRGSAPAGDVGPAVGVRWRLLVAVVAVLAVSNMIVNSTLTSALYVPWNLTVALVVVWLARRHGLAWSDLGWDRSTAGRAARTGLLVVGLLVLAYLVGAALPWTRSLFEDARASDPTVGGLLYHVGVQIPLGTVVLEEVAFRGVLPAALGLRGVRSWRWLPMVGASVLFGLWHVLPSMNLVATNAGVGDALDGNQALAMTLAVVGSSLAGLLLCGLRWLGRGLLTPVLVHTGTNTLGFALAWAIGT